MKCEPRLRTQDAKNWNNLMITIRANTKYPTTSSLFRKCLSLQNNAAPYVDESKFIHYDF